MVKSSKNGFKSLILVDEIMNATDPMEGQILAEEICHQLQRGSLCSDNNSFWTVETVSSNK